MLHPSYTTRETSTVYVSFNFTPRQIDELIERWPWQPGLECSLILLLVFVLSVPITTFEDPLVDHGLPFGLK